MAHRLDIPRRYAAFLVLGAVSTTAIAFAAEHRLPTHAPTAARQTDSSSPYDRSEADRALQAFDKSHPDCELWSDWHKLCQRIGFHGATYCQVDASRSVKASAPFCARQDGKSYFTSGSNLPDETRQQRLSRFRFSHLRAGIVRVWDWSRPFDNRTFQERSIKACKVYAYITGPVVTDHSCVNRRVDAPGYCFHDLKEPTSYQRSSIACKEWSPGWGAEERHIRTDEKGAETETILLGESPNQYPFQEN